VKEAKPVTAADPEHPAVQSAVADKIHTPEEKMQEAVKMAEKEQKIEKAKALLEETRKEEAREGGKVATMIQSIAGGDISKDIQVATQPPNPVPAAKT
jgi:hypothetical protein